MQKLANTILPARTQNQAMLAETENELSLVLAALGACSGQKQIPIKWMRAYGLLHSTALSLVLAVLALASGCSRRGDFSAFFVQEVVQYGGRIDTNTVLPKLQASWTVKEANKDGFTVYVTGASWADVDALMRVALGKRARSSPERVYGEADRGVGVTIRWIFINGHTEVECTRGEMP